MYAHMASCTTGASRGFTTDETDCTKLRSAVVRPGLGFQHSQRRDGAALWAHGSSDAEYGRAGMPELREVAKIQVTGDIGGAAPSRCDAAPIDEDIFMPLGHGHVVAFHRRPPRTCCRAFCPGMSGGGSECGARDDP